MLRSIRWILAGLLLAGTLLGHDVVWWENPTGSTPNLPLVFYYPNEYSGYFYVDPTPNEPCIVQVNLNPSNSTLVSAQVLPPNPSGSVEIRVLILRPPSNHLEKATLTGEWHATGSPKPQECTAILPNFFSVPITVTDDDAHFKAAYLPGGWVQLDSGHSAALSTASSLLGPWMIIGQGKTFTLPAEMPTQFFHLSKEVGGFLSGTITDNAAKPYVGLQLGLKYGGATALSDSLGGYSFPRLPAGYNLISVTNPVGASLNLALNASSNAVVNLKVAFAADPPVTNVCNCTPWCAIGFGTQPDGTTPIYFAGGANSTKNGDKCDPAVVTVTPPKGPAFTITPGSHHRHNSGPNPAAGTWQVTTTVCGHSRTATITVP